MVCSLSTRHCSKHFASIVSQNLHSNLILTPSYRKEIEAERLSNLPKVIKLEEGINQYLNPGGSSLTPDP